MFYINIDTNPNNANAENDYPTFYIHPNEKTFLLSQFEETINFRRNITPYFKNEIEKKITKNFLKWVQENYPYIDKLAFIYCFKIISSHLAIQYANCYSIANEITKKEKKITIICTEKLSVIDNDWSAPVINLIAILNAASENGTEVNFIEKPSGIIKGILTNGFNYNHHKDVYKKIKTQENNNSYLEKISDHKILVLGLTHRFLENSYENPLHIIAGGVSIGDFHLGGALQLKQSENPSITINSFLSTDATASIFEKQLFKSILEQVITPFCNASSGILNTLSKEKSCERIISEEIISFENIGLITAALKLSIPISVVQHSSNPIIEHMFFEEQGMPLQILPSRIYYNNKAAKEIYLNSPLKDIEIIKGSQSASRVSNEYSKFGINNCITIIENDFFRNFGNFYCIPELLNDMITTIQKLLSLGFTNYIWRQRNAEFNPILEILKDRFPKVTFLIDSTLSVRELTSVAPISIGFAATSSLALDYIKNGGLYFFCSSTNNKFEYVTDIDKYYKNVTTGAISVCRKISQLLENEKEIEKEMHLQISVFNEIWAI